MCDRMSNISVWDYAIKSVGDTLRTDGKEAARQRAAIWECNAGIDQFKLLEAAILAQTEKE